LITASLFTILTLDAVYAQDELRVWKEFVASLKKGVVPPSF